MSRENVQISEMPTHFLVFFCAAFCVEMTFDAELAVRICLNVMKCDRRPKTGKVTERPTHIYRYQTLSLRVWHNSSCFYQFLSWESGRRVPYTQSLFPFWKRKKHTTFDPFWKILPDAQLLFPFLGFCSRFRSRFNWIRHFVPDVRYNFAFSKRIRYRV